MSKKSSQSSILDSTNHTTAHPSLAVSSVSWSVASPSVPSARKSLSSTVSLQPVDQHPTMTSLTKVASSTEPPSIPDDNFHASAPEIVTRSTVPPPSDHNAYFVTSDGARAGGPHHHHQRHHHQHEHPENVPKRSDQSLKKSMGGPSLTESRRSHSRNIENPIPVMPALGPIPVIVRCGTCEGIGLTKTTSRFTYGTFLYCASFIVALSLFAKMCADFFSQNGVHEQHEKISLLFAIFVIFIVGGCVLPGIFVWSTRYVDVEHYCLHCRIYLGRYKAF